MTGGREGFLARWSRRKAGLAPAQEPPEAAASRAPASAGSTAAAGAPVEPTTANVPVDKAPAAAPLPTLDDVAALTRDSDYAPFMRPGVDGSVRNAAMKKLFSDPHFNVMDGLDTYIDDYGKPDPLPLSMLRRLNQSAALGLFRDDPPATPAAAGERPADSKACPDGAPAEAVAPSTASEPPRADPPSRAEDDPDLRLQPDDVDRRPGAGAGPRS
jgi:hypothetical protein